ncbi:MAG: hypothetical protein ABIK09_04715 [Pseudomonadota bacterium]
MPLSKLATSLAVVTMLLGGCDGSGRLKPTDRTDDVPDRSEVAGGDAASPDQVDGGFLSPGSGPTVSEIVPLPLADYGPAFWMAAEVGNGGLLEVVVWARDLTSLVGFAVQVTWDPELLELTEAVATAPVGGPDALARGVAAGLGPGRLTMGVTRFPVEADPWNPQPLGFDLLGNVEMGRFVLRPVAPGDAVLRFREGHRVARRPDHSAIPCAWAGLQVRIVGDGPGSGEAAR